MKVSGQTRVQTHNLTLAEHVHGSQITNQNSYQICKADRHVDENDIIDVDDNDVNGDLEAYDDGVHENDDHDVMTIMVMITLSMMFKVRRK